MSRRWIRASVLLLVLSLFSASNSLAQGGGQNDAGTGADASNDRAAPTSIPRPGFYQGQLASGTDEHDWYRFSVPTVTGAQGRPTLELLLFAADGRAVQLELYRPGAGAQPTRTGVGPSGAEAIRHSLDADGRWIIHIFGSGLTARYDLTLSLITENDAGLGLDAADSATPAGGTAIPNPTPGQSYMVRGTLNRPDPADVYRFNVPAANSNLLVSLHHPQTAGMTLSLLHPTSSALTDTGRTGPGFATVFATGAEAGAWAVRIGASTTSPETADGPYVLAILINPPAPGPDAEDDFDNAMSLPMGLQTATLSAASPSDLADAYKLTGLAAGRVLRVGTSAHTADLQRPQLVLTLHRPDRTEVARRVVCGDGGGLTWSILEAGTWYVRVAEAETVPGACPTAPASALRTGPYALFADVLTQSDPSSANDASAQISSTDAEIGTTVGTGWLDRSDSLDVYRIGPLDGGDEIRSILMAIVPEMVLRAEVFDRDGESAGAAATSQNGVARLELTVPRASTYYLFVEQDLAASSGTEGPYRLYARSPGDEAPVPVMLRTPLPTEVRRTTIHLSWTQSFEEDFVRYELHRSQDENFAANSGTLGATITERETTEADLTGLESGKNYTFLVRVMDGSNQFADSNRVTVTMNSGAVGNSPPTLRDGGVDPDSGSPSTLFTFQVRYTDSDDDPPVLRRVYIDGAPNVMTSSDSRYTDGAVFTFSTTLPPGVHSFFFEFNDGDVQVRDPLTGTHRGPEVSTAQNRPPTVTASADPQDGPAPLTVQFSADANDPDGDSLSYAWDFDNSNGFQIQSRQRDPSHRYTQPGTYTATVRVTDAKAATSTDSVTINVRPPSNEPPTVEPTAEPASGLAPLNVKFDANAQDGDGSIASYSWDFDNSDGLSSQSTDAAPSHTYTRGGSFTATVTVRDNDGATATGSVTVLVRTTGNQPPSVVIAARPVEGAAPLEVSFTADATDPDGDPLDLSWDFDQSDGVSVEATGSSTSHVFERPGFFVVTATARDPEQSTSTGTLRITVFRPDQAPGALVTILAEPMQGKAPLTVHFKADTSRMPTEPASFVWDFGDGTSNTTEREPNHAYERAGTFTVKLTVTDEGGNAIDATLTIKVSKKTPGLDVAGLLLIAMLVFAAVRLRARPPEGA